MRWSPKSYVTAVALIIFSPGSSDGTSQADAQTPQKGASVQVTAAASVLQIMNVLTTPSSEVVFSAVSTISSARGVETVAPKNDQDWQKVEDNAAMLVESGNLLLIGNRVRDEEQWIVMTRDFIEASMASMQAARAKDVNALYSSYDRLALSCERCHLKYFR